MKFAVRSIERALGAPNALLRRLTQLEAVPEAVLAELSRSLVPRQVALRTQLLAEGEGMATPWAVVSGWACHVRQLWDGRRQLLGLIMPGEVFGRAPVRGALSCTAIVALTPMTIASSELLRDDEDGFPGGPELRRALRKGDALVAAHAFNHITRLGRQTAYERTAHLLLELRDRLEMAGEAGDDSYPLPLTQETLADLLGLTAVHMNRTLQQLRRDGLIEVRGGRVKLLQPQHLTDVAEYVRPRVAAR